MRLCAFLKPAGNNMSAWRLPEVPSNAGINFAETARLAQTAERGTFDAVFFADFLGVPWDDQQIASRLNAVTDNLEPITLISALASVTSRIGLIATASTTYSEPYNLARWFASIDHISGGRAGWSLVTSVSDVEARNFGRPAHMDHALRYERAEEFHDVVDALWNSYEDDAFSYDHVSGIYFDAKKLHRQDHVGKHFKVAGPLNISRPVQGRPVIIQAGASDAGRQLAARVADVFFAVIPELADARAAYADIKQRAVSLGRNAEDVLVMPGMNAVIGRTRGEAEDKMARLRELNDPVLSVALLSYYLGTDVSGYDLDGPLPELPDSGNSSTAQVQRQAAAGNLTIRQLAQVVTDSEAVVGTAEDVADHMENWWTQRAADGFNVYFPYLPGALADFVDLVVPELRRRNLFRTEYEGRTLRENLGLPRPAHPASLRTASHN